MTSSSVLQAVQHYQRNIEKNSGDVARLLHCVGKLYKLPITVEHLQETGVGRTVNDLRKHNGELGIAAESVVNKWKELVASENDKRANHQSSEHDSSDNDDDDEHKNDDDDGDSKSSGDRRSPTEQHSHKSRKHEKSHHKEVSPTSSKRHHDRQDRHKNDSKDSKRHSSHHKDKHRKEGDSEKSKSDRKHENAATTSNSSSSKRDKKHENHEKHGHSTSHKRERDEEKNIVEPDSTVEIEKKHERSEKHKSSSKESSRDKEKHKKNDEGKHGRSSSSSGKHKQKSSESKDKEKEKSKSHKDSHSSHSSHSKSSTTPSDSNKEKPSTSAADTTTTSRTSSSSTERKRRHEDSTENEKSSKKLKTGNGNSSSNVESTAKRSDDNNDEVEVDEDGIDSSMGANFADVLGMLNMPKKKAKKSINSLQQQTSPKKQIDNEIKKSSSSTKLKNSRDYDGPSTSSAASSTLKNLEKKPDLLTSNVKLEPLDPSIALELPIISNNYKPLPLNPTVMDCVFNSSTSSSSRAPPRLLSDAEAFGHGISSKTIRTKVYSGVRSGQLFQVPSLFDLCIRVLQKNIDAIEYTGGVPFDVLRPVLERASPQQLFVFEEYNPYIMEDTDVLWQQHVQRTYRTQKRQEMETWREMFMRCQDESERRLSMLAQNIKQSQKIMAEPVRKTQLAFVDTMVKPPRGVMKKQEQYGTKSKMVATPAARVAALSSVTPNAAKTGDARLRAAAAIRFDPAQVASAPMKPKKAPLMAKTLQFIRGRQRR